MHLIHLDPEWQCNTTDDEHVAVGTGETVEAAIDRAAFKALNEQFTGRLFSRELIDRGERVSIVDLRGLLGIKRQPVIVNRRI